MKSLLDYELLNNEVFYRCHHILEYIENNKDMSDLDREAIKATIMDALVHRGEIDPEKQSLDFENLAIVDDKEHYTYEKHPNVCGIPLWMKEQFRTKCLKVTGGVPISVFLAKPESKRIRFCVYDQNTAVSSLFDDATFYEARYDSPTRPGKRLKDTRPFVEINLDGENYLVDTITKRIFKTSWFKEKYNMETTYETSISSFDAEQEESYRDFTKEETNLRDLVPFYLISPRIDRPDLAEYNYELEKTKETLPEEWEKGRLLHEEFQNSDYAKLLADKPKQLNK